MGEKSLRQLVLFLIGPAFFLSISACSASSAKRQNTQVEDLNGIKEKISSVENELSSKPANKSSLSTVSAPTPVKTIAKSKDVFEFESEGAGLSTKYERPVDAEKRGEEDALSKAVKEAGVNVYSGFQNVMAESANTSYQFIGKYINVWSNSLVSYERVAPPVCTFSNDTHHCTVKIRGKVYFKGDPDPNFELRAKLSKPAYYDGDDVNLQVNLTKDAYITVLNCDEDGNVTLIYPNRLARKNLLTAGKDLNIPEDLPFQLKALLPQGRPESGEILHIIATKSQPLVLLDSLKEEKNGIFLSYSMGGVKDLVAKLAKFDRSDWTAQVLIYGVKNKK